MDSGNIVIPDRIIIAYENIDFIGFTEKSVKLHAPAENAGKIIKYTDKYRLSSRRKNIHYLYTN